MWGYRRDVSICYVLLVAFPSGIIEGPYGMIEGPYGMIEGPYLMIEGVAT